MKDKIFFDDEEVEFLKLKIPQYAHLFSNEMRFDSSDDCADFWDEVFEPCIEIETNAAMEHDTGSKFSEHELIAVNIVSKISTHPNW